MKCSKAQKLINDHVDDLLDTSQVGRLESHIKKCANCRDFLADMGSIVHNAEGLGDLNPSEGLWPEIKREVLKHNRKARIHGEGFFGNFPFYPRGVSFALSALLVIMLLIPLIYYGLPHIGNSNNAPESLALNHFKLAEQHYQSAIEALDQAIAAREGNLSPELTEVFNKNLAIIDDSIRICKTAVEKYPENPEANSLLLICYRKKIELLNKIKDLTMQFG